jgi:antitoxin component YwqK of YwqJK toxin-antitoxin module
MAKVVRTYYNHEQNLLSEKYYEVNGKKEGVYKMYYENGQLKEMNNYIDGNIIEYKLYYNNGCKLSDNTEDSFGQLYMVCNYVNGKLEGEFKSYYSDGQLKEIYNFIDGVKQT